MFSFMKVKKNRPKEGQGREGDDGAITDGLVIGQPGGQKVSSIVKQFSGARAKTKPAEPGDVTVVSAYDPSTVGLPPASPQPQATSPQSPGLSLPSFPPLKKLPDMPVRASAIRRQPRGDFGIILRCGVTINLSEIDQRLFIRDVIFAEPTTVSPNQPLHLLPGDELLDVGDTAVIGWTRDDIVSLFRTTADTVILRIRQAAEFREISALFFAEASSAIQRSSAATTWRLRRSVDGSSNSIDQPSIGGGGNFRWLNHSKGFCLVKLVGDDDPSAENALVHIIGNNDAYEEESGISAIKTTDLYPRNPVQQNWLPNVSLSTFLNEPCVLNVLIQRFANGLVHTLVGPHLVAMHPQRPITVQSESILRLFRWLGDSSDLPHPFSLAARLLQAIRRSQQDQSVVFLGISGSGKSTALRGVASALLDPTFVRHWCGGGPNGSSGATPSATSSSSRVLAALSILDAFGSSAFGGNSRYALLLTINYDQNYRPAGCVIAPTFLDRTLFCQCQSNGPNLPPFAIFSYMLAGLTLDQQSELMLMSGIGQENQQQQKFCVDRWATILAAMEELNVTSDEREAIMKTLAAIIHLYRCSNANGSPQVDVSKSIQLASDLLGCSPEALGEALNGGGIIAFCAGLYDLLFTAVSAILNRQLSAAYSQNRRAVYNVHLVDMPGLQRIEDPSGASFMDFCFNYLYERLLNLYLASAFTAPVDAFRQEGITTDLELGVDEIVVANRSLLELIDGRDQNAAATSLFCLLDQEALVPKPTEDGFLNRLFVAASQRPASTLKHPVIAPTVLSEGFVLAHGLGQFPVFYKFNGWLAAMAVSETQAFYAAADLLRSSSTSAPSIFSTLLDVPTGSSLLRPPKIRRSPCLSMKVQLDNFLEPFKRTSQHSVLSILPYFNPAVQPALQQRQKPAECNFSVDFIRSQSRSLAIEPLAKLQKYGCTESFRYTDFVRNFRLQLPTSDNSDNGHRYGDEEDLRRLTTLILQSAMIERSQSRFGKTKVFLSGHAVRRLEASRTERLGEIITRVQALARGYLARQHRKRLQTQHCAVRCIQRNFQKYRVVQGWPWWKLFASIRPILNVQRSEDALRRELDDVAVVRGRCERAEAERAELFQANAKLQLRVRQLESALAEQAAAHEQTASMLEAERAKAANRHLTPARPNIRSPAPPVLESRGEEIRLEEYRTKANRLAAELSDTRRALMSDIETARSALADAERRLGRAETAAAAAEDEARRERMRAQSLQSELDSVKAERVRMDCELSDLEDSNAALQSTIARLKDELNDLSSTALPGNLELATLRRRCAELTSRINDQEQELDDQAGEIQQLQSSKLQLQLQQSSLQQQLQKAHDDREDELQDVRASLLRRARAAEQAAEDAESEKLRLTREKNKFESELRQLSITLQNCGGIEATARLRERYRATKALLAAAEVTISRLKVTTPSNRLASALTSRPYEERAEEAEEKAARLLKAKQRLELELAAAHEEQQRLQIVRTELEKRCAALGREKAYLEDQLAEKADEIEDLLVKLRAAVAEQSVAKATINSQADEIVKMRNRLYEAEERVAVLTTRLDLLLTQTVDKQDFIKLETQTRTVEVELQLEKAERTRAEGLVANARHKAETSGEAVATLEELLRTERQLVSRLEHDLASMTADLQANMRKLNDSDAQVMSLTNDIQRLNDAIFDRDAALREAKEQTRAMQSAAEALARSDDEDDFNDDNHFIAVVAGDDSDDEIRTPVRVNGNGDHYHDYSDDLGLGDRQLVASPMMSNASVALSGA